MSVMTGAPTVSATESLVGGFGTEKRKSDLVTSAGVPLLEKPSKLRNPVESQGTLLLSWVPNSTLFRLSVCPVLGIGLKPGPLRGRWLPEMGTG